MSEPTTIGEAAREAMAGILFPELPRILQNFGIKIAGIEEFQMGSDGETAKIIVTKTGTKIVLALMELSTFGSELKPLEMQIIGICSLDAKEKLKQIVDEHNLDPEKNPWKICLVEVKALFLFS